MKKTCYGQKNNFPYLKKLSHTGFIQKEQKIKVLSFISDRYLQKGFDKNFIIAKLVIHFTLFIDI